MRGAEDRSGKVLQNAGGEGGFERIALKLLKRQASQDRVHTDSGKKGT